jgi:hypothetical protein
MRKASMRAVTTIIGGVSIGFALTFGSTLRKFEGPVEWSTLSSVEGSTLSSVEGTTLSSDEG